MLSENTIVALASPSGIGAIGVIRISGTESISIASKCFESHRGINLIDQSSHKTFL
jgi:tRNA modification GTPase